METNTVLNIENLTLDFFQDKKALHAVNGVSIHVNEGEMVAIVGESGCGKTLTAMSVIGLLPEGAKITDGTVKLGEKTLTTCSEKELESIRGKDIAVIFQEPMTALNPLIKVGKQIAESLLRHTNLSKAEAKDRTLAMLRSVGLADVEKIYNCYPHQLSGGMRQRIVIAMALINNPKLIVADEPTTALDVTIQAQIMELIKHMNQTLGTAVLLISHDLGVIKNMCSRVYVMYAGVVVESGEVSEILTDPLHPYTKGLIKSIPNISKRGERLMTIEGTVEPLESRPERGCLFYSRCESRCDECKQGDIPLINQNGHAVRCLNYMREGDYGRVAINQ